jgi:Fibronectin type III domain.
MSTTLNYSKLTVWGRPCIGKRIEWNVRKFRKTLILIGFLGFFLLILPTAWSSTRFEMEPGKVAVAEVRMWQAYYANDHTALRQELTNLLRNQFGLSVSDANDIGEPLARAAMKFESEKNNYNLTVLPYIESAYSMLKDKLGTGFDPKEAAGAELEWWVARRTPGIDSVEDVGRLIARLYTVLFGEDQPAFERAGLLRAQAAHMRDEEGESCHWGNVEQLLLESYQALQEGIKLISNNYSGQVVLSWDPNKENNIAGYKIYYGNTSGKYDSIIDVGNLTSYTIKDLKRDETYYFAVTAYNTNGSESGYAGEVSHKATVALTLPSLPQNPEKKYALEKAEQENMELNETPYQNPEVIWLPQGIDLNKHSVGPFTIKVRADGIDEERYPSIILRIKYYIGTGNSYGYFDMTKEEDGVWKFDILDPNWYRYRSKSLRYHVIVFDDENNVITESNWQKELIDSFVLNYN